MAVISDGFDAVVPRLDKDVEPLHAVYGKNCLIQTKFLLDEGVYSVSELFKRVRVCYVDSTEIDKFDPEHLSFFNINNENDLDRAHKIIHNNKLTAAGTIRAG